MKRIVFIFLLLIPCYAALQFQSQYFITLSYTPPIIDRDWTYGTKSVTRYNGNSTTVTIPSYDDNYRPIVQIGTGNNVCIGVTLFSWESDTTTETIIIPSTVTSLTRYSIYKCLALREIVCYAEIPPAYPNPIWKMDSSVIIYVPDGAVDVYKQSSDWNAYTIRPLSEYTKGENYEEESY